MKKYLFIVCAAVLSAGLTGCNEKESTRKGTECTCTPLNTVTLDLTIMQKDWQFDDNANQFFCHFDIPEITSQVYNYGNWTICREYNKGAKDAYQVALPMSCFMTDTQSDGTVTYYTQYIDYRLGVGYVEMQLTNSDYLYVYDQGKPVQPEDMFFRLQMTY